MMSALLTLVQKVDVSAPRKLFQTTLSVNCSVSQYAVAGDGQKFFFEEPPKRGPEIRQPLHIITNWQARLPR